jgi:hypothetical protein
VGGWLVVATPPRDALFSILQLACEGGSGDALLRPLLLGACTPANHAGVKVCGTPAVDDARAAFLTAFLLCALASSAHARAGEEEAAAERRACTAAVRGAAAGLGGGGYAAEDEPLLVDLLLPPPPPPVAFAGNACLAPACELLARLAVAEAWLERTAQAQGRTAVDMFRLSEGRGGLRLIRNEISAHGLGLAIDINYASNPWLGGDMEPDDIKEEIARLQDLLVEVEDRQAGELASVK